MANSIRCRCARCTCRGLMGPAILITLGVLFLLDQWRGDSFSFRYTWPILLIVIGAFKLAESTASTSGHATGVPPIPPAPGQNP